MLQILTIAVRQIIHAFASAIKNSQILMLQQDYLSKKGGKTSGRKASGLGNVFCFFINLEE